MEDFLEVNSHAQTEIAMSVSVYQRMPQAWTFLSHAHTRPSCTPKQASDHSSTTSKKVKD